MIRKRHMFGRAKAAAGHPSDSSCAQACEAGCGNGIEDSVLVDAIDAMQVGQVARLPEMLDAKRLDTVTADAAEPGECRRVSVDHCDQRGIPGQRRQQAFNGGLLSRRPRLPGPLRRLPASVETVGGGDREQAGVRNVLEDLIVYSERLWCDRALVDDGQLRAGSRRLQPITTGDDRLA